MSANDPVSIHEAFKRGDLEALKSLLSNPRDFPNCRAPEGFSASVLEYAIYHSPMTFVHELLELGADPNYADDAGFPCLIAALSCRERDDRHEMLTLLLDFGADIQQRGHNDYTPLHYAAALEDLPAIELLIARGADPDARTRIDDHATPLEEARILKRERAAALISKSAAGAS